MLLPYDFMRKCPINHADMITISPEIMRGIPLFKGTWMPIQNLLDYLKDRASMDGFLTVSREQGTAFFRCG